MIGLSSTYPEGTPADEKMFLSDIERDSGVVIERVPPIAPGLVRNAEEQVWYSEGLFVSGLGSVSEALMRRARRHGARVALTGVWGDQMLFEQAYLMDLLGRGAFGKICQHLNEYGKWFIDVKPSTFRRFFLRNLRASLIPDSLMPWFRRLKLAA